MNNLGESSGLRVFSNLLHSSLQMRIPKSGLNWIYGDKNKLNEKLEPNDHDLSSLYLNCTKKKKSKKVIKAVLFNFC